MYPYLAYKMTIKKQSKFLPFLSICLHGKKKPQKTGDLPSEELWYKYIVEKILTFVEESGILTQIWPMFHVNTHFKQKPKKILKICG